MMFITVDQVTSEKNVSFAVPADNFSRVVVSTAVFHARVRGSVWPICKFGIVLLEPSKLIYF